MGIHCDPRDAYGNLAAEDHERLSCLVLIHQAADELPVTTLSELQGRALLVDIATGRITSAEGRGVKLLGELRQMHGAAGRSMKRLLARLFAKF